MPISELALREFGCPSKCQPSPHRDSLVCSVPAALQGVDDRFASVNPCDLRAREGADLFCSGRYEVGQQGPCDPGEKTKTMSML